jgi:putative hemin transport protein
VLDPDFNLHLREDAIASTWVVFKPTRDGTVTSLELYDKAGFCFAQLFGARKPGKPELQAWRDIVAALPKV